MEILVIPIPELLMDSGLPVHIASYGCSYLRRSGSSLDLFLSDRFMDHWPLRVLIVLQSELFSLNMLFTLPSPVVSNFLAKHTNRDGLIMVSLRFIAQQVNGKDLLLLWLSKELVI